MASGQDAHRGERPPRTARDASRGSRCPGRTSSHPGGTGVKKSGGGAGRDPSYKMGEGIVFSTVFFWRLRPEIGSNCHPVGSSSKTPSDALQAFSMETGQAGGESVAECGSGGRFSAGGRFYQVTSAIEHNGHYAHCFWQAIGPFSDLNGDLVIASRVSPQEPFRLNSVEPQWR